MWWDFAFNISLTFPIQTNLRFQSIEDILFLRKNKDRLSETEDLKEIEKSRIGAILKVQSNLLD
jgi:hypothetical protein